MFEFDLSVLDKQPTQSYYYEDKVYRLKQHEIDTFKFKLRVASDTHRISVFTEGQWKSKEYIEQLRWALHYLRDCDLKNRNRKSWYDYC